MADPPPYSNAGDDAGVESEGESTGTPRWVKVFGIIAIIVAVLFIILLVAGGGHHGPSRHRLSSGRPSSATLSANFSDVSRVLSEAGDL